MRAVQIYTEHPTLKVSKPQIKKLFAALDSLKDYAIPSGELSIALLTDDAIVNIHGEFMDDSSKTDVITFPGD
ncbi:MAG TPA: hypothetical protein PLV25_04535, partial [Opitutales bacterium]|nr:hypothetical protein [Opitutales bacterium]